MTLSRHKLAAITAGCCKGHFGMRYNRGRDCSEAAGRTNGLVAVARMLVAVLASLWLVELAGGTNAAALGAEPVPVGVTGAGSMRRFSSLPPSEMTRADVYTWSVTANPRAVLVLCPGFNGNGEELIRQPAWQEFARTNHIALCAISFASPEKEVLAQHGYYLAARGSGDVLLHSIRIGFGRDLPILAYGFSGGAHFTASLVNWKPERILSWCAYSAAWWEEPAAHPAATPPGIVACGDADAARYGASLTFFNQGRAFGRPWTWVSLGGTEHARSVPLDQFVRAYFAAVLRQGATPQGQQTAGARLVPGPAGTWRDVDTKEEVPAGRTPLQPMLACWLPDRAVATLWSSLHHP